MYSDESTKDLELMSQMAAFFCRSAMNNVPEVYVDIDSFRTTVSEKLEWFGEMEYNGRYEPLTISIEGNLDNIHNLRDFIKTYFEDMINSYLDSLEKVYDFYMN